MKRTLLAASIALAFPAYGADLYFCNCATSAQSGCSAGQGSDSNVGTIGAPKATPTSTQMNNAAAGDRFLMCQGGSWDGWQISVLDNANATPTNPIVMDWYQASWGGAGVRPLLRVTGSGNNGFNIGFFGVSSQRGGYTFSNITLDGTGVGQRGFQLATGARNVSIVDSEIRNFVYAITSETGSAVVPSEFSIQRSNIHDNSDIALLGEFQGMLVENNTFSANNFSGSPLGHAIYLGGHDSKRGIIRNNVFTGNSVSGGVCTGGNLTVHGMWDDVVIENNTITQTDAVDGCWGIVVDGGYSTTYGSETYTRFAIRGNTVVNVGLAAILVNSMRNSVIEGNVIVKTIATGGQYAISVATRQDTTDSLSSNITIRNNSFYSSTQPLGMAGIRVSEGTGHAVTNNLVALVGTSNATNNCFEVQALSSYTIHDYNLCYLSTGTIRHSNTYATLAAAQAAGFDTHSVVANPLFAATPTSANNYSLQVQSGSPARSMGTNSNKSRVTRDGYLRDSTPDVGAYEFGATQRVAQPPSKVR